MKADKITVFEAAVPDLKFDGLIWRGTCPHCGRPTLALKPESRETFQPVCEGGCSEAEIRDGVRAVLKLGVNGTDGKAPEAASGALPPPERESAEEKASGVSVVGRKLSKPEKTGRKPPDVLEPEAYHGLPGRVMRTIAPHTESHPAGILGSFLTGGGCLIGPGPHVFRDGFRHACNEFVILMGKTGSGRKGTATRRIEEIFRYTDNSNSTNDAFMNARELGWNDRVVRGLGSGEALVAALAATDQSGDNDGRRMVFETEFSRCLKVMARENSTLSDILRAAWDSDPLAVRTKGNTLRADSSHVSMLAHVTEQDLRERLANAELFNGFANRFLWLATRRVGSLPFGGGVVPLAPLVLAVHQALAWSASMAEMKLDRDAAWIWEHGGIYGLLNISPPGLLGAVTERGAPHVTRIALQYAVWDQCPEIGVRHLLAGLAVWDYSFKTCAYLFGRSTGDNYADLILERLREAHPGYLTRQEIRDLFSRNAAPGRIPAALELLEELGLIERRKLETEGRSAEIIVLADVTTYDGNAGSPLEAARRHARSLGYTTETTETT